MAGFEGVVRPMIFPAIRPAARPSVVPAEADPEQGQAVIRGASATTVALPYSYTTTWTVATPAKETQRTYDVARVYQKEDAGGGGGAVNRDSYVDVEVMKHIKWRGLGGDNYEMYYTPVVESDNVEIRNRDQVRKAKQT